MRHLTASILLILAVLLFNTTKGWSLPSCPGSYNETTWTYYFGNFTFANGDKYVGEFKDGNRYGQGFEYNFNGTVAKEGIWENVEFKYAKKS